MIQANRLIKKKGKKSTSKNDGLKKLYRSGKGKFSRNTASVHNIMAEATCGQRDDPRCLDFLSEKDEIVPQLHNQGRQYHNRLYHNLMPFKQ